MLYPIPTRIMFFRSLNEILVLTLVFRETMGVTPKFRILAPQFVCPKDEDSTVNKPDNTVITLQTAAGANFEVSWTVRWSALPAPSQRFTLMLWKAVRALETKLNGPQPEPYVYIIDNNELLDGVNYVFYVTSIESNGDMGTPKSFQIDNTQGNRKLSEVEGRADLISIVLVGGQVAYADMEYVLEAQVTSCYPTQDYYFIWTVRSTSSDDSVDVSYITGSRLEIPPYSLKPGITYDVNCQVIKHSNGYQITQTGLPFQVLHRQLEVYLSVDNQMVTVNQVFFLEAVVLNHDYYDESPTFTWECTSAGEPCDFVITSNNNTVLFPSGIPRLGEYEVSVSTTILDQSGAARATILTVEPTLPVIQISPMSRIPNEGTIVSLVANASNVAPTCSLTWYFASEEYLLLDDSINATCEECQHGEALSETLTIFSLEENFLNELTDYTNETEWRQVTAEAQAAAGRARFVAQCGCSLIFDCETKGTVYAELRFWVNKIPKASEVMVTPESGSALETVFRISTLAVVDTNPPLRYSFYCRVGVNDTLLLGTYVEHLAVETLLPYIEGGTEVWVEVCDALGACSTGDARIVHLSAGEGATLDTLVESARAHIRRCELILLRRVAVSAFVTYTNGGQPDVLTRFTSALLESLPLLAVDAQCMDKNYDLYLTILHWLANRGVDTTHILV